MGGSVRQQRDRSGLRIVKGLKIIVCHPMRFEDRPDEMLEPRTRGPDRHASAFQIGNRLDYRDDQSQVTRGRRARGAAPHRG